MREIRFRVWDKVTKTMSPSITMNQLLTSATKLGVTLDGSMVLLQWTGLKDKSGKDIFEGDVVKRIYDGRVFAIKYSVYGWGLAKGSRTYTLDVGNTHQNEWDTNSPSLSNFKVIGNIYENKDLLNA